MTTTKISEVVLDFDLYPRASVDSQNVAYLSQADAAGAVLPPIIIDKKSKRVVDGFHRVKMYRQKYDDNFRVEVVAKAYPNEQAMLLDAMRYNSGHGRSLTRFDRVRCIVLGEKMGVDPAEIAAALHMTSEKVGELKAERVGELKVGRTVEPAPLKRTIRHMSGKRLSRAQYEANKKLSGMNQAFYVNQVITLIENKLLNYADADLLARLAHLAKLIKDL